MDIPHEIRKKIISLIFYVSSGLFMHFNNMKFNKYTEKIEITDVIV